MQKLPHTFNDNHRRTVTTGADTIKRYINNGWEDPVRITLSSDDAKEILLNMANPDNRNLRPLKVRQYAKEMEEGEFHYTGQAIVFTKDGMLAEGHHRLNALSKCTSDTQVNFNVAFGIERDAIKYIDIGAKRRPGDHAKMDGVANAPSRAAIARVMARITENNPGLSEYHEIEAYVKSEEVTRVLFMKSAFSISSLKWHTAAAGVAAWAYAEPTIDNDRVKEFFDTKLAHGMGITDRFEAAAVLRNKYLNLANKDCVRSQDQAVKLIKTAFERDLKGFSGRDIWKKAFSS